MAADRQGAAARGEGAIPAQLGRARESAGGEGDTRASTVASSAGRVEGCVLFLEQGAFRTGTYVLATVG